MIGLPRVWSALALCVAAAAGQFRPDSAFTLRNWGGNGNLENLLSTGEGLSVIANRAFLFRSSDAGKSWRPFPLPSDGSPGENWNYAYYDEAGGRLYRSSFLKTYSARPADREWSSVFPARLNMQSIEGSFSIEDSTFVVLDSPGEGINVSRDGGRTWKQTAVDPFRIEIISLLAAGPCALRGASNAPVAVSCDGGTTHPPPSGGSFGRLFSDRP